MNDIKGFREKRSRYIKKKVKQSVAIINSIHQSHLQNLMVENKIDETNCFSYSSNTVDSNSDIIYSENIGFNYFDNNNLTFNEQSTHSSDTIMKDTSLRFGSW